MFFTYNIGMKTNNETNEKLELLTIYRNYLYSLEARKEFGDKYGDSDELIDIYEKKLIKTIGATVLHNKSK